MPRAGDSAPYPESQLQRPRAGFKGGPAARGRGRRAQAQNAEGGPNANEADLPGTGSTRIVVTDTPPEQHAVLRPVGLGPERFQGGGSRLR